MTTEPVRDKDELQALVKYFTTLGEYRNALIIILGVCTTLRISDLLGLKWSDVYDESTQEFKSHVLVREHKTGKAKSIALNSSAIEALTMYRPLSDGDYIFSNGRKREQPISRQQAWRIVKRGVDAVGVHGAVACHSLRKTWGYHAWKFGGVSPVVIMQVYNHSSFDVTRRYLGVAQDDLDSAYLGMNVFDMDGFGKGEKPQ